MNTGQLATILVSVLVCGVLIAGMLPIFGDVSASEDTFENKGLTKMMLIDESTDVTVFWDHTDPANITVGDKKVPVPQSSRYPISIICSDEWGLRYLVQSEQTLLTLFDTSASTLFNASTGEEGNDMTVTISNGVATFDNGTTTKDESFTTGYCISDVGDYVMKSSSDSSYLNGDSIIFGTGRTSGLSALTSPTVSLNVSGTIDDGVVATSLFPGTYTTSDVVINYSDVDGYEDLYSFASVQFAVNDASDHTANATYNQVIVPAEVTAERSVHMSDVMSTIIQLVPLLAVVGLVLATIGYVLYKRL